MLSGTGAKTGHLDAKRGRRRIHAKIYQSARLFKIFVLEMLKNCRKSDYNVSFMHFFCGFLSFFIAFELAWEAAP
jgi:hypothetical protein